MIHAPRPLPIYLLDGHGRVQFIALCQRLLCQLAPLLLQRAHPLLHGVLVGFIRFGHQILTSSQNPLILGLLGLELRLQNLSMVDPNTTY